MPIFVVVKNNNLLPHPAILHPIGRPFTVLNSIDSTNNYAMAQALEGRAQHGAAWFALEQTAGKGQRGRTWLTAPGDNIILSTVIQPGKLPHYKQFLLSAAMALACYEFFKNFAGDETRIKWPNDIYWRDRKAAGILIENRLETSGGQSNWEWAIVGMGVNINQSRFDGNFRNPVSLRQITGKQFDVQSLGLLLCQYQEKWWQELNRGEYDSILKAYNNALYRKGEKVRLRRENTVFETKIIEVTASGQLSTSDVITRLFSVGEVEWVL